MMHMFRPVRQVVAPVRHQTTLFGLVRQEAAPGEKSAHSDCILCVTLCGCCADRVPQSAMACQTVQLCCDKILQFLTGGASNTSCPV